eukprot:6441798-Pyramimonas_sp.AAC.1
MLAWVPYYLRNDMGASMELTAIFSTVPFVGMAGADPGGRCSRPQGEGSTGLQVCGSAGLSVHCSAGLRI